MVTQSEKASEVRISGMGSALPPRSMDLAELHAAGRIRSTPAALAEMGFKTAYVCSCGEELFQMALRAARDAMADAGIQGEQVDLLIWAGGLAGSHVLSAGEAAQTESESSRLLGEFRYPSARAQAELGLDEAAVLAVAQQGCATMYSALATARAMILSDPRIHHVLCVGADALPKNSCREVMYNLISDAACAVVVSRGAGGERWIADRRICRGYYWDTVGREAEIVAAYFATSRAGILDLLANVGLGADEIDLLVCTGVNQGSWDVLGRLVGISPHKLFRPALPIGHTVCADSFIALGELRRQKRLTPGSRSLLFTYGFGSTWWSLLLEH